MFSPKLSLEHAVSRTFRIEVATLGSTLCWCLYLRISRIREIPALCHTGFQAWCLVSPTTGVDMLHGCPCPLHGDEILKNADTEQRWYSVKRIKMNEITAWVTEQMGMQFKVTQRSSALIPFANLFIASVALRALQMRCLSFSHCAWSCRLRVGVIFFVVKLTAPSWSEKLLTVD